MDATGTPANRIFTRRAILTEIWEKLPIWFLYLESVGFLHFIVANVPQIEFDRVGHPASSFAWTTIFPLGWVVAYYTLRVRDSKRLARYGLARYLLPLALLLWPLVIYCWYRLFPFFRCELAMSSLVGAFEAMQLGWIVLFIVHCWKKRGLQGLLTFFVVAWLYGMILENGGIIMGYFVEPNYKLYLWRLPAPFATMMGWCLAFYACIRITEDLAEKYPAITATPLTAAFCTTAVAISLDLQLDPLASLSGVFWKWNDKLPAEFLSVPWANYVAWFSAFMPFSYIYYHTRDREDLTPLMRNWRLLTRIPNVIVWASLIFLLISFLRERGFSGPTFQVMRDFFDKILPY